MGVTETPAGSIMKLVLLTVLGLSAATPVPEDAAAGAPLLLPYGYPGLVAYPYALPVYPSILHTGVHYPLAEAYVHDGAGDVADGAAPAAEAYVHVDDDAAPAAEAYIHVAGDAVPAAEAYVHDVAGDVSDDASLAAEPYVHDTAGDA